MERAFLLMSLGAFLLLGQVHAQRVYSFTDMPDDAPSLKELEKKYRGRDSSANMVFKKPFMPDAEKVHRKYRDFVADLGSYLYSNGFKWDKRIRYFQRIYFGADGKAEHYLYRFRHHAPKGERKELFEELVRSYLSKNDLGIEVKGRFAMCAPVVLKPKEKGDRE